MSAHRFAGRKIFVFCACCSKACYECLLNFHNQREHEKLDRNLVLPVLRKLEKVEITKRVSQSSGNRLDELLKKCESEFERSVLLKMVDAKLLFLTKRSTLFMMETEGSPNPTFSTEVGASLCL